MDYVSEIKALYLKLDQINNLKKNVPTYSQTFRELLGEEVHVRRKIIDLNAIEQKELIKEN